MAAASIIRFTGGNFRLLNRLVTKAEQILEINALPSVTKTVVEAVRENLSGSRFARSIGYQLL